MQSIILISPHSDELENIFIQWKNEAKCNLEFSDRLTILTNKGHFLIDYLANGKDYYDDNDLVGIKDNDYYFYSICYSDKENMAKFILKTIFQNDSFLDNDYGKIETVESIKKWSLTNLIDNFII